MFRKFIFSFFIILCQCLNAQQPATIPLSEKDGLPDIEFYTILEDRQNYIWLAADKGLYRYNGRSFTHFLHPLQKGNAVFGVQQDHKNRIWCNNISGQFFFVEDQKLKLFLDLGPLLDGQLAEFLVTEKELIVLPGKNSIRVDLSTKNIRQQTFSKDYLVGSAEQTDDGYLFSRFNHIIKADANFKAIDSLKLGDLLESDRKSQISKRVNIASHENIQLCYFYKLGQNFFYRFQIEDRSYDQISIPKLLQSRTITHSFFHDNEIWLSTDQGLFICELKKNELQLKKRLFSKSFITKVLKDQESNFWLTTKGDGIFVLPNINIFDHQYALGKLNIGQLERINEDLLVFGTNDGKVGLFYMKTFQYELLKTSSAYRVSEITKLPKLNVSLIIKEDKVLSLDHSSLLLRTLNSSIIEGAKSFSRINDTTYVLSSYKEAIAVNKNFEERLKLISKRSYINYHSAKNQSTYIGTVEGLYALNSQFRKTEIKYKNQPILTKNVIEVENGDIWVASLNKGLFGIRDHRVFKNYNEDDGLLSNTISAIQSDGHSLWIATDQGIQYLNPSNDTFQNLTKQNGIPSYRISDIEVNDMTVFFATNTGIFSIQKDKAFKDSRIPKVYISDVSVGLESLVLKQQYDFNHNDNAIKISFNSNGFQSFIHNKYEFRLLGQSDIWQIDENNANAVSFYSLPSGDYTFQVKSVLADRNDPNAIDSIQFSIAKPFWKEWWFYGIAFLIVGVSIYWGVQRKINTLKKNQSEALQKELINKQLVLSQLENLRSQMNPHFIFNALNSIQEYIVFNEKELARSYLIKFSRLIRIYLEHSRENEVLLSEEINALNIYLELEKNRFEDTLHYEIKVPDHSSMKSIKIPSLFIQPYVENAIKHGLLHKKEDRQLLVEFTLNEQKDVLYCKIRDNGIGIEASTKINRQKNATHKSFALSANQKRVRLLNTNRIHKVKVETFDLSQQKQLGTEVVITIPLTTSAL